MKKLRRSYAKLMKNDDVTGILRKSKIRGKWCHSGNPLSEAGMLVEYFELKITDNQNDDFLRIFSKNNLSFS